MESYEVLEQAIPKKESGKVAQFLNISADYVRRWRREPDSDESPTGSGQRSILDRICDLIDAVFLVNPHGPALIVNYVNAHYHELLNRHAQPIACRESQAETGANLLTNAVEAVNSIQIEGCTPETLRELIELRDNTDLVIKQVEKTMKEAQDAG